MDGAVAGAGTWIAVLRVIGRPTILAGG